MKKILVLLFCLGLAGCATSAKLINLQPPTLIPYATCPPKISYVSENSIADKVGLKSGDIIKEVDGQKVTNLSQAFQAISSIEKEGILTVERNGKDITVRLTADGDKNHPSGIFLFSERYTFLLQEKIYSENVIKDGIQVSIIGPIMAENNPLTAIGFQVANFSEKDIAIYPDNIAILDGNNTVLKMFGGKILASNVAQRAEERFRSADRATAAAVASAQSQPPSYTIYTYDGYGRATPQPNYSAAGAAIGRAFAMLIEKNKLRKQQRLAEQAYMNTFEFGVIPKEANKIGTLYCQTPTSFPLKIRVVLNNNKYNFKWVKPEE